MTEEETKEETEEEVSEEELVEAQDESKEEEKTEKKPEEKEVDSFQREMHKAVCADCGKECEVPFQPTEGRPVYCRDCYSKHRPQRRRF
jgi:CxxC-x17-CxxC domain-containing protein